MPDRSSTRPTAPDQLTKLMVEIASGKAEDQPLYTADGKNAAAVMLGRRGGLKGGRARADGLLPEQRSEIASKAAKTRWEKERSGR